MTKNHNLLCRKWTVPGPFLFIFVFSTFTNKQILIAKLLMAGIKPGSFGVDHSANFATTTSQQITILLPQLVPIFTLIDSYFNHLTSKCFVM